MSQKLENKVDHEKIRIAEKENDRMLLHISLNEDKKYFDLKQVIDH